MSLCPHCDRDIETEVRYCSNCGYDLLPTDTLNTEATDGTAFSKTILKVGSIIQNRFHIVNEIGSGGTGFVYKAHDTVLDEVVAIKVLKPELASDDSMISTGISRASNTRSKLTILWANSTGAFVSAINGPYNCRK